jgi:hypothetical protein
MRSSSRKSDRSRALLCIISIVDSTAGTKMMHRGDSSRRRFHSAPEKTSIRIINENEHTGVNGSARRTLRTDGRRAGMTMAGRA